MVNAADDRRGTGPARAWAIGVTWGLTGLRILLIPLFVLLSVEVGREVAAGTAPGGTRLLAAGVLLLMGLSDVLDGLAARRLGTASRAGAVADAVADKGAQIVLLGFFTLFTPPGFWAVPLWFFGLVLVRDAVLVGGGIALHVAKGPVPVEHSLHGRVASVVVFAVLLAVTAGLGGEWLAPAVWGAGALVLLSTAVYVRRALTWWVRGGEPGRGGAPDAGARATGRWSDGS